MGHRKRLLKFSGRHVCAVSVQHHRRDVVQIIRVALRKQCLACVTGPFERIQYGLRCISAVCLSSKSSRLAIYERCERLASWRTCALFCRRFAPNARGYFDRSIAS